MFLNEFINQSEESSYTLSMVIKDYDKCIELNPNFAYAYFNRAYLKFQNEKKSFLGWTIPILLWCMEKRNKMTISSLWKGFSKTS